MKRFYCQLYCYSTSDEITRSHRIWCLVTNKLFFSLSSSCILFTCIVASAYMLPVLVLPLYFSFVCVTCVNKNRQLLAVTAFFFLFFFGNCSVKPIGLKILISPPVFFFFLVYLTWSIPYSFHRVMLCSHLSKKKKKKINRSSERERQFIMLPFITESLYSGTEQHVEKKKALVESNRNNFIWA